MELLRSAFFVCNLFSLSLTSVTGCVVFVRPLNPCIFAPAERQIKNLGGKKDEQTGLQGSKGKQGKGMRR